MNSLILILCLIFNICIFNNLFEFVILNLVLIFQCTVLMFYIIQLFMFIIKKINESKKLYNIDQNDKDKFKYYREIIKDYSIGELGYIFNKRIDTKTLIMAEVEYLKLKGAIKTDKDKIIIIKDNELNESEKYILDHYKFINEKDFKKYYLANIEKSLKEKGDITPFKIETSVLINCLFIFVYISFFVSWFLMFYYTEIVDNFSLLVIIEISLFLTTFFVSSLSMGFLGTNILLVKTKKGNDVYARLMGLKRYIKDFGNFEDRRIREIKLWEEFILYAIILDESDVIEKEAKKELENLINIIYK